MPDAWDDDPWITKDKPSEAAAATIPTSVTSSKVSKAERRRQQAEFNRQIWERENHETPENDFFLQSKGIVPVKSDFKPQMVLSRRPNKPDETAGAGPAGPADDDEDDNGSSQEKLTAEQRQEKAQTKLEEKQRAYDERRRELFGDENATSKSKTNSNTASPRNQSRVKGLGSRPSAAAGNKNKQLFDPNETSKPDALRFQGRGASNDVIQPIREPRAPDASGRGGFGFSPRGGRNG